MYIHYKNAQGVIRFLFIYITFPGLEIILFKKKMLHFESNWVFIEFLFYVVLNHFKSSWGALVENH